MATMASATGKNSAARSLARRGAPSHLPNAAIRNQTRARMMAARARISSTRGISSSRFSRVKIEKSAARRGSEPSRAFSILSRILR